MISKQLLTLSGFSMGISVVLGAFAAHGLKSSLSPYLIGVFDTGVQYQFIHSLAILACGVLLQLNLSDKARKYFFLAAICFIIGILCFSGSLYALALTGIKWFGPVTPLGGMFYIVGWGLFTLAARQLKEVN